MGACSCPPGTAASGGFHVQPYTKDLSTLPGGGLIIIPNPLYGFAIGTGLASATTNYIRFYYTQIEISDAQYYELWQSRVMLTA